MKQTLLRYLKRLVIGLACFYLLVCVLLYAFQHNLLFHPQPRSLAETALFLNTQPDFDTLSLMMADGTRIGMFLSKDTSAGKQPLILYFGGNAEEVSHLAGYRRYLPTGRMALVNYRGFGRSQGSPSEQTMLSDALDVYDQLTRLPGVDKSQIIIFGRSIGTGVATYLSSKRPVKATVLITPYESMASVAQGHYPLLPVSLLLKHRFESKSYATGISSPVLALVAKHDQVIPPTHAYALIQCWKGPHRAIVIDADHNSILDSEEAWTLIRDFVNESFKPTVLSGS